MKVGIGSMVGMSAVGSIANIPGMPTQAKTTAGVVNTGLGLANVGVLAETGMGLGKSLGGKGKKERKHKRIHW